MSYSHYSHRIAVTILTPNDGKVRWTEWVSYQAVFLLTDTLLPRMQLLRFRFTPSMRDGSSQQVVLNGIVIRVSPRSPTTPGGVEVAFFAKGGDEGRRWDAFVEQLRDAEPQSGERIKAAAAASTTPIISVA